jgi:uncharacterized protein YqiB (DUF1249 family)
MAGQARQLRELMTLYESNFVRLGWLVADLRSTARARVARRSGL